jgi:hypothetical protein
MRGAGRHAVRCCKRGGTHRDGCRMGQLTTKPGPARDHGGVESEILRTPGTLRRSSISNQLRRSLVSLRSTRPRRPTEKRVSVFQDRAERLRKARATAPLLREVCPRATHIAVRLQFQAPSHTDQSFVLYPGARAYFGFPCPYGDCDGIYDLSDAAQSILQGPALQATGTLDCGGVRSRHRIPRQTCRLQVNYIVTARRAFPPPAA